MLTPKQRVFVAEYLRCWNASEAARRAGYSEKTAYSIGAENLRKPEISAAISAELAARAMGPEEVLARLGDMARGSVEDFGEVDEKWGTFQVDLAEAKKRGKLHLIKKIKPTEASYEIELYDAQAALVQIGRHHKLFTDKVEIDETGLSDDERATRVTTLLERARARRDGHAPGNDAAAVEPSARPSDDGGGE